MALLAELYHITCEKQDLGRVVEAAEVGRIKQAELMTVARTQTNDTRNMQRVAKSCIVTAQDPLRALREIACIIDENRHLLR